MGFSRAWMKLAHRNRVIRKKEEESEARQKAIEGQKDQQKASAELCRKNNLSQVITAYANVRRDLNIQHEAKIAEFTEENLVYQTKYHQALTELNRHNQQYITETRI